MLVVSGDFSHHPCRDCSLGSVMASAQVRSLLAGLVFSAVTPGPVGAEGWSQTGTPAMEAVVKPQPPVLHECPSLPHKERALQFSGQSDRAEAERGGCFCRVTCFISIPLPRRRRLHNSRRFQSGKSQIRHAQIPPARQQGGKTHWTWCSQRSKTLTEWKPPHLPHAGS